MIKHLSIRNYALIRELTLDPSEHLNVITGETGAGKSIMLGAIGLLLGNRADTKVLWDESEKCITEGTFAIGTYKLKSFFKENDLDYDETTVIRREISPAGKSRAFINDTPVTLDVLRQLGLRLLDIHSQHETLELGKQDFQLTLVDAFGGHESLVEEYRSSYVRYTEAHKALKSLIERSDALRQEADFLRFQVDEIQSARFEVGEQESLESEQKIMEHSGDIKQRIRNALQLILESEPSGRSRLSEALQQLQGITSYAQAYESYYNRLASVRIELDDLANELSKEEDRIDFDPERSTYLQDRLGVLYKLLRKHNLRELSELLELRDQLQGRLDLAENIDAALASAKQESELADQVIENAAAKLRAARLKAIKPLTAGITKLLTELGMPQAQLEITLNPQAYTPRGADAIDILFSANKGIPPRTLASVASGGEFSRLMFAIKYVMAEKTSIPTLILDEIDSGISGEVAFKLAGLMKEMAARHQLITITHLPSVAAKGNYHYYVYKNDSKHKTVSEIKLLTDEARVLEIAKMIGGDTPSQAAFQSARELLS